MAREKKPNSLWHNKKGRSRAQWLSSLSSLEIVHNVNNSKWWTWRNKYSLKHYLNFGAYILFYFLSFPLLAHDSISYCVRLYVRMSSLVFFNKRNVLAPIVSLIHYSCYYFLLFSHQYLTDTSPRHLARYVTCVIIVLFNCYCCVALLVFAQSVFSLSSHYQHSCCFKWYNKEEEKKKHTPKQNSRILLHQMKMETRMCSLKSVFSSLSFRYYLIPLSIVFNFLSL